MKHINIFLIVITAVVVTFTACASTGPDLVGSWSYSVEQTMPEYSKGTLVLEEAENDELSGKFVLSSGTEIPLQSVSVEADTLTFSASVQGTIVTTVCTVNENMLTGSVKTPQGLLPFSAEKQK